MTQVKKTNIENKILRIAKILFIKHGYIRTSLRDIAARAKVTLSNLYNYFHNKDALFIAVLKPELDDLERLCKFGKTRRIESGPFETVEEKKKHFRLALDYITTHKNELNLLLNQSHGSSLENYSSYLAEQYEENWNLLFSDLKKKYQDKLLKKPSSFFLKNMAHFHLMTIGKILFYDYDREEMNKIADEIATFLWHGGMGIIIK